MREKIRNGCNIIKKIKHHPVFIKIEAILIKAITLVFIVMLLFIFFMALLLVWGRVFAPDLPDSLITTFWAIARDWGFSRELMATLRNWTWYPALCHGFRDTDGSLAPLMYLLGIMGGVGFATGAINEVKSHRSMGMLMSEVICSFFPLHMLIQVVFHFCFTVLGWYACTKNVGIAASFCALGLFSSSLYSLNMARAILFSSKARDGIVTFYIENLMRQKLESKKVASVDAVVCVLDYAKHLGQQWSQGNILQIHKENNDWRETLLINLTICALSANRKFLKSLNPHPEYKENQNTPEKQPDISKELRIRCDFCEFFSKACDYGARCAEYVLFTKALHFIEDREVVKFKQNIRYCGQIWEQLFAGIQNDTYKARLAYIVLKEAWKAPWIVFSIMAIGLLEYLKLARIDYAETEAKELLQQKICFLHAIRQEASEVVLGTQNSTSCEDDNNMWAEIMYIVAALLQWMEHFGQIAPEIGHSLTSNLTSNVITAYPYQFLQDLEIYVVMAYLLFSDENENLHRKISAYMMQYLEPVVYKKLRRYVMN